MFEVEPVMVRIGEGLKFSRRGEREAARRVFAEMWSDIGEENGDPLHRFTLAHAMADLQDHVSEELLWDLGALEARDDHRGESSSTTSQRCAMERLTACKARVVEGLRDLGDDVSQP